MKHRWKQQLFQFTWGQSKVGSHLEPLVLRWFGRQFVGAPASPAKAAGYAKAVDHGSVPQTKSKKTFGGMGLQRREIKPMEGGWRFEVVARWMRSYEHNTRVQSISVDE